jgi:mRNA interferase MazF
MAWTPERGDVVWITMNPSVGHEQDGRRPALVLSPGAYNGKVGLAILCPVTSQAKGYPFEVPIPEGLPVEGVVLSDQAKTLDWRSREAEFACKIPAESTAEVLRRLATLVGSSVA